MACAMVKHFGVGVVTRPEVTLATPVAPFAAADSLRSRSASSTLCGASLAVAWQSSMLMSEIPLGAERFDEVERVGIRRAFEPDGCVTRTTW